MSWLTYTVLCFIHALYSIYKSVSSYWKRFDHAPQPLNAPRTKLPTHLALLLVPDDDSPFEQQKDDMLQTVEHVASWCKDAGIEKVSVYDREGLLQDSSMDLRDRLQDADDSPNSSTESEPEYPLTPPLSDVSESRTLTPEMLPPALQLYTIRIPSSPSKRKRDTRNIVKRRKPNSSERKPEIQPITLHLISRSTGKPAVAKVAQHFLQIHAQSKPHALDLSITLEDVGTCLEGERGLPPPDLMIVHDMRPHTRHRPLELHGFPPWQVRLTEFYQTRPDPLPTTCREDEVGSSSSILAESEFRRALDEFSTAEMRLGK
ncbi:hypothetical protein EIP91_005753 [Steccherinum ochraceum]|uniref:ditrans,polycis-polyprenyl diphosphate synthase [(2E,6E)-farnesyldiphosphate specific] n=1 Tax=Steccherinum ochraceum TaxID=92696 RepID=A0A4R0RVU7_9APHY|nr:hypothetical protein EIP91_005753 [Steccherinum ochraceum]